MCLNLDLKRCTEVAPLFKWEKRRSGWLTLGAGEEGRGKRERREGGVGGFSKVITRGYRLLSSDQGW